MCFNCVANVYWEVKSKVQYYVISGKINKGVCDHKSACLFGIPRNRPFMLTFIINHLYTIDLKKKERKTQLQS